MRTSGSCRFEPFYKVEVWTPHLCAWKVIQKAFKTEQSARQSFPKEGKSRVVKVTEAGYEICHD
jgi:hypothetical protein